MKNQRICKTEFEYKVRNVLSYVLAAIVALALFAVASAACWCILMGVCLIAQAIPTFGLIILSLLGGLIAIVIFACNLSDFI
jgi:hypothetical protein